VGTQGRVIAVDVQQEMLDKLKKKLGQTSLINRFLFHLCPQERISLDEDIKANFILAYYMAHETPDQRTFFSEVKNLLKPGGKFLLVEPPFHVSKKQFQKLRLYAEQAGLKILSFPSGKGGHSLLFTI
jgi:ubiquinone/menaquinone biosynthesis C-methylase UbiE